jgi:hypothetical protein
MPRGVGMLALTTAPFPGWGCLAAMGSEYRQLGGGTNPVAPTEEQSREMQVIMVLERTGRYDEAEARCIQILEQRPNDQVATRFLSEIQARRRQENPLADLKHKLADIVIPEVNVREAAVADVIDSLQTEAQKRSADKAPINIVWQAPEELKTAKVTLILRSVPLTDVLKYVTEIAGLRYRVDAHAVVIYKPVPTAPKESSSSNVKSP